MPTTTRDLARVARFRMRRLARAVVTRARAVRDGAPSAAPGDSGHKGGGRKAGRGKVGVPDEFFAALMKDADVDAAFVRAVRRLIANRHAGQARALSHAIATHPGLQVASDLCRAMVAEFDPMVETAWRLMQRNDLATVLRLIPVTYVRIGLRIAKS